MISVNKHVKTVVGALLLLSSFAGVQTAFAVGTPANTTVSNSATVNYSVSGVPQTAITSAAATFVVDNRIDFDVTEVSSGNTIVTPGQAIAVLGYRVTNTGNAPEGFQLSATNEAGTTLFTNVDNTDFNPLNVFVDNPGAGGTAGVYDAGFDTAANINTLAADANVVVFVVVNVPLTATNAQFANVQLQARAAQPGTGGATLELETGGPDTAGVDIVFGDTGEDNTEAASDQYAVESAALAITKASAVISDPFNAATNPKAIPGATVEYVVTIANTGAAAAGSVNLTDTIGATLTFVQGQYNGGLSDVQITVGVAPAQFCVAEAGADANTDGCSRAGQTLTVNPTAPITVGPGESAVVRFRVTIN